MPTPGGRITPTTDSKQAAVFSGESPYSDIVVIRFPSIGAVNSWFSSPAYQALIPLREQAAEVVLVSYDA